MPMRYTLKFIVISDTGRLNSTSQTKWIDYKMSISFLENYFFLLLRLIVKTFSAKWHNMLPQSKIVVIKQDATSSRRVEGLCSPPSLGGMCNIPSGLGRSFCHVHEQSNKIFNSSSNKALQNFLKHTVRHWYLKRVEDGKDVLKHKTSIRHDQNTEQPGQPQERK